MWQRDGKTKLYNEIGHMIDNSPVSFHFIFKRCYIYDHALYTSTYIYLNIEYICEIIN